MWKYDEICGMMCGCGDLVFVLLELLELTSHDESKLTQKWQRDSAWQRGSAIGWKRMPPCQLWQAVASCGKLWHRARSECQGLLHWKHLHNFRNLERIPSNTAESLCTDCHAYQVLTAHMQNPY